MVKDDNSSAFLSFISLSHSPHFPEMRQLEDQRWLHGMLGKGKTCPGLTIGGQGRPAGAQRRHTSCGRCS